MGNCKSNRNLEGTHTKFTIAGNYNAYVCNVVDGDTVDINIKIHGKVQRVRIRIAGYDTAETKPRDDGKRTKASLNAERLDGMLASQFLRSKIDRKHVKVKIIKPGKFGDRWIGDITHKKTDIKKLMLDQGHGYPYDGKTKTPYDVWRKKIKLKR